MLPSRACVNVILSARSEPASGAHGPALREASLRAEPTGLPCAKRACERSPRVPPQDDTQRRNTWELLDASRSCSHVRPRPLNDGDQSYFPAPILKIFVPQTGQAPSVAGRPFFIVICLAFLISRWALHFMQ